MRSHLQHALCRIDATHSHRARLLVNFRFGDLLILLPRLASAYIACVDGVATKVMMET